MRPDAIALVLALIVPVCLPAQHGAGAGTAAPAFTAPREATQFDFLVGHWDLVVTPRVTGLAARIHGAPRLLGTWKAWRAFDGFGVEDELRIVDGSGNPSSLSHALRVYNPTERKWTVTGLDVYRTRWSSSTGEWSGREMVLRGEGTDAEGKAYVSRTRFTDITPGAFRYQQDRSVDGGKTWTEGLVKIDAKRVAATAPR